MLGIYGDVQYLTTILNHQMFKPRKKGRQEIIRNHVFKLSFAIKGQRGGLAYLFQAPSKSSLYRW